MTEAPDNPQWNPLIRVIGAGLGIAVGLGVSKLLGLGNWSATVCVVVFAVGGPYLAVFLAKKISSK